MVQALVRPFTSSTTPLQLLSTSSQLSIAGTAAVQADQPEEGTALHLRQILMVGGEQGDPFSVAEVCAAVRKARSEIRSSREFSEFASRYSVVAPETGGDLGWMHLDELAPYMGELVEGLEAGEVSRVMELPVGCTIVQLVEKREFKPVSLEEATEKLTNQLYEMKLRDEYRAWMEELRENTFIERRGYFAAAADFKKDAEPASDFESGLSGYDMLGGGAAEAPATP